MSGLPKRLTIAAMAALHALFARHVEMEVERFAAGAGERAPSRGRARRAHRRPRPWRPPRPSAARSRRRSPRRSGDQRDLSVKPVHVLPPKSRAAVAGTLSQTAPTPPADWCRRLIVLHFLRHDRWGVTGGLRFGAFSCPCHRFPQTISGNEIVPHATYQILASIRMKPSRPQPADQTDHRHVAAARQSGRRSASDRLLCQCHRHWRHQQAICTDGVGYKVVIAELMDRYDTIGIDCIAMNVNDLICVGALNLFHSLITSLLSG